MDPQWAETDPQSLSKIKKQGDDAGKYTRQVGSQYD